MLILLVIRKYSSKPQDRFFHWQKIELVQVVKAVRERASFMKCLLRTMLWTIPTMQRRSPFPQKLPV